MLVKALYGKYLQKLFNEIRRVTGHVPKKKLPSDSPNFNKNVLEKRDRIMEIYTIA
jgi:hypothetical protein